eukprot:scaffold636_cov252-Pinguiococcus_pyrenoidosus.AAC.3
MTSSSIPSSILIRSQGRMETAAGTAKRWTSPSLPVLRQGSRELCAGLVGTSLNVAVAPSHQATETLTYSLEIAFVRDRQSIWIVIINGSLFPPRRSLSASVASLCHCSLMPGWPFTAGWTRGTTASRTL